LLHSVNGRLSKVLLHPQWTLKIKRIVQLGVFLVFFTLLLIIFVVKLMNSSLILHISWLAFIEECLVILLKNDLIARKMLLVLNCGIELKIITLLSFGLHCKYVVKIRTELRCKAIVSKWCRYPKVKDLLLLIWIV